MIEWDWPTYFLFGSALAFAFVCLRQYDLLKCNASQFYLFLGLLPCCLLFAFRHPDVGMDLVRYARSIDFARYGIDYYFLNSSGNLATEPLSRVVKYVSYHLGGIQPFIIITSVIQYVFIFLFLRKLHLNGFNIAIFFLIYFSVIQLRSCSMVRNGLALSASFCAYSCMLDKEKKYFWIYTFIALGFHNSAIINIPIYFICQPVSGGYWKVLVKVFLKLISIVAIIVFLYAMKMGFFSILISEIADAKYSNYEMSGSWGLGNLIIRIPLLVVVFYYLKDLKDEYGENIISFFYFMIFDLIISQSRYIYSDFERLTQYSSFGEIVLVSLLYDVLKKRVQFPIFGIYFFVILLYYTYYMYRWAILGNYGLMPFKFMNII